MWKRWIMWLWILQVVLITTRAEFVLNISTWNTLGLFIQITCHISLKVSDRPQTSEETLTTVSPVTQHVAETLHTVFYSSSWSCNNSSNLSWLFLTKCCHLLVTVCATCLDTITITQKAHSCSNETLYSTSTPLHCIHLSLFLSK